MNKNLKEILFSGWDLIRKRLIFIYGSVFYKLNRGILRNRIQKAWEQGHWVSFCFVWIGKNTRTDKGNSHYNAAELVGDSLPICSLDSWGFVHVFSVSHFLMQQMYIWWDENNSKNCCLIREIVIHSWLGLLSINIIMNFMKIDYLIGIT